MVLYLKDIEPHFFIVASMLSAKDFTDQVEVDLHIYGKYCGAYAFLTSLYTRKCLYTYPVVLM